MLPLLNEKMKSINKVLIRIFLSTIFPLFLVLLLLSQTQVNAGGIEILQMVETGNPTAIQMVESAGSTTDACMLLHTCVYNGFLKAAHLLIDNGADINCQHQKNGTPLHTAVHRGQVNAIIFLLDRGADVNTVDLNGITPLNAAIIKRTGNIVALLLNRGADPSMIHHVTGMSPLKLASEFRCTVCITLLVKAGADLEVRSLAGPDAGLTVLMTAIRSATSTTTSEGSYFETIETLITEGASVNVSNNEGNTLYHEAMLSGGQDSLPLLIKGGADFNRKNNAGFTPLQHAIRGKAENAIQFLLELGASQNKTIDLNTRNLKGTSGLHDASSEGFLKIVEMLISAGTIGALDMEVQDFAGTTALHKAAKEGQLEMARLLLNNGAQLNKIDDTGLTPSHYAAMEGRLDIIHLFLNFSLSILNVSTNTGHSMLHAAAYEGQPEICSALLDVKSQDGLIFAKTSRGQTALQLASSSFFLLSGGLKDTNSVDKDLQIDLKRFQEVIHILTRHEMENNATNRDNHLISDSSYQWTNSYNGDEGDYNLAEIDHDWWEAKTPWPWSIDNRQQVVQRIGLVNATFRIGGTHEKETRLLPLHRLPIIPMPSNFCNQDESLGSETCTYESKTSSATRMIPLPQNVQSGALHSAPMLKSAARRFIVKVTRLRKRLCDSMNISADRFWSGHFPYTKLQNIVKSNKKNRDKQTKNSNIEEVDYPNSIEGLQERLMKAFQPFMKEMRPVVAKALRCNVIGDSEDKLVCPHFGVYMRFERDQFLNGVHRDFPGEDERVFNLEHGTTRDDWWNVWFLLSESSFLEPLALLDPLLVPHSEPGYLNPNEMEQLKEGPDGETAWRAFTYADMKSGDAMLWRTTKVPHAGMRRIARTGEYDVKAINSTLHMRQSIDFRCICLRNSN